MAAATLSRLAPPPISRKLAGSPPKSLTMSMRGHGQARAVDHAADVAIQLDVGQAVLARLGFGRRFLVQVAHLGQVGVAEQGIVIDQHLAVQRHQLACPW